MGHYPAHYMLCFCLPLLGLTSHSLGPSAFLSDLKLSPTLSSHYILAYSLLPQVIKLGSFMFPRSHCVFLLTS